MKNRLLLALVVCAWAVGCAGEQRVISGDSKSLKVEKEELARLKSEEFNKWKAQAVDTSQDRSKRGYAVLRIAELGSDESARFLEEVWETPLDVLDHEKTCLVNWSGEYGSDACVPLLKKATAHPFQHERWLAARALLRIQGAKAVPLVIGLAENETDAILRSELQEFISNALSREKNLESHCAIVRAIVRWGKSPDAEAYITEDIVYLLRQTHPRRPHPSSLESDSLRLYSITELKLLGKGFQAYAIPRIEITGSVATAVLRVAIDPPACPAQFPHAGWTLDLEKKNDLWSVAKAVKNGSQN
ncbi:MAG: HEAT repeat domain-containing protein [Verrucomicrobiales bacterium]